MCMKGKTKVPRKPGNFECRKCGATHTKKDKLCKPQKVK